MTSGYHKPILLLILLSAFIACSRKEETSESPMAAQGPALQKVLVEIDSMKGLSFPPTTAVLPSTSETVTLKGLYAPTGLDIETIDDSSTLTPTTPLSEADLDNLLHNNESVKAPDKDTWKLYGLVVTRFLKDPDARGFMFTNDTRHAFAIFSDSITDWNDDPELKDLIPAEFLRVLAHEASHCFNVHHPDFDGDDFLFGSTLESSSRADTVVWKFSDRTIDHFLHHNPEEIMPGGLPYAHIFTPHNSAHRNTNQTFIIADSPHPSSAPLAFVSLADKGTGLATYPSPLKLEIHATKEEYGFRDPVTLFATIKNTGSKNVQLPGSPGIEYRLLNIEIQPPDSNSWSPFVPAYLVEPSAIQILPGDSKKAELPIFYGASGWTFNRPGTYKIRATYPDKSWTTELSATTEVTILPTDPKRSRLEALMHGDQQGLFLLFRGGDHLRSGKAALESLVREFPDAPEAAVARIALGTGALYPTVEPKTGVRPPDRLEEAVAYLLDTPNQSASREIWTKSLLQLGERCEQLKVITSRLKLLTRIRNKLMQLNPNSSRMRDLLKNKIGFRDALRQETSSNH